MKIPKKIIHFTLYISFVSSIFFSFYKFPLPDISNINNAIKTIEPTIETIDKDPYFKEFSGVKYRIEPKANYKISGLVVEEYDSSSFLDVTHKNDPAQTNDLCLIWGENIKNGIYKILKYSHGEFTCYFKTNDTEGKTFHNNEFTNNHLIPDNDEIKEKIKNVKAGDQVYIEGRLVNYNILDESGNTKMYRNTSLTMNDTDCEVVLVKSFEVLKSRNPLIKNADTYSYTIFLLATVLSIVMFIV